MVVTAAVVVVTAAVVVVASDVGGVVVAAVVVAWDVGSVVPGVGSSVASPPQLVATIRTARIVMIARVLSRRTMALLSPDCTLHSRSVRCGLARANGVVEELAVKSAFESLDTRGDANHTEERLVPVAEVAKGN